MTAVHHYTVRCDHEGCASTFTALVPTAAETRRLASARGWSQRVVRKSPTRHAADDICPRHGARYLAFAPPPEVPGEPCGCDNRGGGDCRAHPPSRDWEELLERVVIALLNNTDHQLAQMNLNVRARLVLAALGYQS